MVLRLFAGVHYLVLAGEEPGAWGRFGAVLSRRRAWLTRFVAEQPVQTNEVQRSWGLLPAFLYVAADSERPLDLIELGPSAGLNLLFDRYRYRYGDAQWGAASSPVELDGTAVDGPPAWLFRRRPIVRSRVGIDRAPVDVTHAHGALLLQAFVWADQTRRLERLRRAIDVARTTPPRLVAGDFVETLPQLLTTADHAALTVVFHSVSLVYLPEDQRERLRAVVEEAAERVPLAWISYEVDPRDDVAYSSFVLDVRVWPGGEKTRLAELDGHANRLRWLRA